MNRFVGFALLFILLSGGCSTCQKEDPNGDDDIHDFDRSLLLQDLAGLIETSYAEYAEALDELKIKTDAFIQNPDASRLEEARAAWRTALIKWQYAAPYEFGAASNFALESATNIYPADVAQIESNIELGSYTLGAATNIGATGLQAMDYMLYGVSEGDMDIIDAYTTAPDAALRQTYLSDLVDHLIELTALVHDKWKPGAPDRETFITNDGTDQGSSLGLFLNAFNRSYEASTRTNKLGTPTGALTFSMTPNPTTVEAYYENTHSVQYLRESIQAFEMIYTGQTENSLAFDDYLEALGAQHNGQSLDRAIKDQISDIYAALDQLQDPLSEFVVSDQQTALDVFTELQALVVLWKVDMMSEFGILITYQDNDGD